MKISQILLLFLCILIAGCSIELHIKAPDDETFPCDFVYNIKYAQKENLTQEQRWSLEILEDIQLCFFRMLRDGKYIDCNSSSFTEDCNKDKTYFLEYLNTINQNNISIYDKSGCDSSYCVFLSTVADGNISDCKNIISEKDMYSWTNYQNCIFFNRLYENTNKTGNISEYDYMIIKSIAFNHSFDNKAHLENITCKDEFCYLEKSLMLNNITQCLQINRSKIKDADCYALFAVLNNKRSICEEPRSPFNNNYCLLIYDKFLQEKNHYSTMPQMFIDNLIERLES